MRRINIKHITRYDYRQPVKLLTHKLHIRPREGHDIRIESSKLSISPGYTIQWQRDIYGNSVALVDFAHEDNALVISSEVTVQHYEDQPLQFQICESASQFPFFYDTVEQVDLFPYQAAIFPQDVPVVRQWLQRIHRNGTRTSTTGMLDALNQQIADEFDYKMREQPGVQSPARTIELASGSCRDVSTLFIEACRALGLASRFVSGYLFPGGGSDQPETTHAWSEVYLPGAGWRGYDSTSGNRVSGDHIAVAHHRHPQAIPPVSGSFLGPRDCAKMSVEVQVRLL